MMLEHRLHPPSPSPELEHSAGQKEGGERCPIDIQPTKLIGVDVGAPSSSQVFIEKDDHTFIVRTIDRERYDSLTSEISHLDVD
ncbi:hypothetical protein BDD14_4841 [Edaphobacter modestus]|uniref:Uncharacterized protein n=1 Tax=Edaphobacter modestus TaxID=388466 RepID=A0A4Q7YZ70_9BACT|nr:hypothetical protein BDD14_4841 [Edaphobacter modestus]